MDKTEIMRKAALLVGLNSKQTKEYMKLVLQEGTESKIKALLRDSGMDERRIGFLLGASWAVTRDE